MYFPDQSIQGCFHSSLKLRSLSAACGLAYPISNYNGSDIAIVRTATGEECARVCAQIVQCACMSYMTNSTCFLKSSAAIPGGTSTLVEAVISYDVSGCKEPANYTVIDLTQPADQAILLKNFPGTVRPPVKFFSKLNYYLLDTLIQ